MNVKIPKIQIKHNKMPESPAYSSTGKYMHGFEDVKEKDEKRIHFGSLEGQVDAIVSQQLSKEDAMGLDLEELQSMGALTVVGSASEHVMRTMEADVAVLLDLERKQKARKLVIPTADPKVREMLRELGEPMTLFGEGPADRRDRLRELISKKAQEEGGQSYIGGMMDVDYTESAKDIEEEREEEAEGDENEEFYTYGPSELTGARQDIYLYSLKRTNARLMMERAEQASSFAYRKKLRHDFYIRMKNFETQSLQIGDDRPIGHVNFSPNSNLLATGGWSGLVKLWSLPQCNHIQTLRGHTDRITSVAFHPHATLRQSSGSLNLASSGADGSIHLHSLDQDTPLSSLTGHISRVSRVAFHPSGKYLASCGFDTTWRLWDAETNQELLLQEGHSRELYALGFQGDGSLVASAGKDSIGRIWDLRTGKSIMVLRGHIKSILDLDWSPHGTSLATASEDNTVRIWDIRGARCAYTIPAHTNIVTSVRFWHAGASGSSNLDLVTKPDNRLNEEDQNMDVSTDLDTEQERLDRQVINGSYLLSTSYDGSCKVWADGDFKPLKSLSGLEGKVMCCDASASGERIAISSYDRTFKLYTHKGE